MTLSLITFTYNGMLKTDEIAGEGNSFQTEFRQYDSRLGKWLSLDPLMEQFPWMSPFVGFDNNPILYVDPYGLESSTEGDDKKKQEGDKKEVEPEKKDNSYIDKDGKIIPDKLGLPDNPDPDIVYKGNNGKTYGVIDGDWVQFHELEGAKVNPNKSKGESENKNKGYGWMRNYDYSSSFDWGKTSGRRVSYNQNALVQQYTNFGNKVIAGSFVAIGAVPVIAYSILTAPAWAPVIINTGGSGYLINAIGRTTIDATAQVTVNGFNNLDVFDAFASGFLTPTGSALLGGSFDYKPFSFEEKYRLVGINKSLAESTIDIGVKYTFGRTGIVGKQTSKLSTQYTVLKAPQLSFIINAPFVLTGKLVNKQIKSTLK